MPTDTKNVGHAPWYDVEREEDLPPLTEQGYFYTIRPLELDEADKAIRAELPLPLGRLVDWEPEL